MKIVIVTTKTCPPCRMLKSYIKDWDKENIVLIDAHEMTPEQFFKYKVRGVPTVFLEDEEKIIDKFTGLNIPKLEEFKNKL